MPNDIHGFRTSETYGNALSALFHGASADFVPVAPLFVDSPFRTYVDDRLCGFWANRIDEAGGPVAVDFDAYVDARVEVVCEVIDRYNVPPCWVRFPWSPFREEVAGARVDRQGDGLLWIGDDGRPVPLIDRLRELDRRPGPWPMEQPTRQTLEDVRRILSEDPDSLIPPGSLGDPGMRWESPTAKDLRDGGCLSVWDRVKARYGDAVPGYIIGSCPTQLLQDVMSFDSLMMGYHDDPDLIHRVTRMGMPKNRAHWQAVRDAGVEIVHVSEYSWGNQVSPAIYREFIAPYTRELIDFYHEVGFRVLLYVMGDVRPVLDQVAAQPFDALAIEEGRKGYDLNVGEIRQALGPDRLLYGNVPCTLVVDGRPEDILAEVRRQVSEAGRNGRFVVSIGEPLPQSTPPERVRFFCDSTRLMG